MKNYNTIIPCVVTAFFMMAANFAIAQCHSACPAAGNPGSFIHVTAENIWCFYDGSGSCYYNTGNGTGGTTGSTGGNTSEGGTGSALPVVLGNFYAKQNQNTVTINWETYSEKNSDNFQLLWSRDGHDFEIKADLKSRGNSTTSQKYSFEDKTPVAGLNYYMLIQRDIDGNAVYSKIISAKYNTGKALEITFVQNNGQEVLFSLNSEKEEVVQLLLSDLTGKIIENRSVSLAAGINDINVNLPATGMYIFNLFNENIRLTEKVLK